MNYLISEVNPFPFVKRWNVYINGKWMAKFRNYQDAQKYIDNMFEEDDD